MQSPFVRTYFDLVDAYASQTGLDVDTAERALADRAEQLAEPDGCWHCSGSGIRCCEFGADR